MSSKHRKNTVGNNAAQRSALVKKITDTVNKNETDRYWQEYERKEKEALEKRRIDFENRVEINKKIPQYGKDNKKYEFITIGSEIILKSGKYVALGTIVEKEFYAEWPGSSLVTVRLDEDMDTMRAGEEVSVLVESIYHRAGNIPWMGYI